jgi:hypothetical protein
MVSGGGRLRACADTDYLRVRLNTTEMIHNSLQGRLIAKIRAIEMPEKGNPSGFP